MPQLAADADRGRHHRLPGLADRHLPIAFAVVGAPGTGAIVSQGCFMKCADTAARCTPRSGGHG
jgi:hypothetical protein